MENKAVTPDLVNGVFEGGGAVFALLNVRRLLLDWRVRGFSPAATIFWLLWGYWNIYYYAEIQQPWSWWGGVALSFVNTTYVLMILWILYVEEKGELE